LKSMSACEAGINVVTGCDSEQEQAREGRAGLASEALFDTSSIRIGTPCFIIAHIPPCMQQWEAQADWHEAAVPFIGNNIWKEPHRPTAKRSVVQNALITIPSV